MARYAPVTAVAEVRRQEWRKANPSSKAIVSSY
jgi:hypothetical protein